MEAYTQCGDVPHALAPRPLSALKVLVRHAKPKEHAAALRLFWEHRTVALCDETCAALALQAPASIALKDTHSADEILAAHPVLMQQRRHTWLSLSFQVAFGDLEGAEAAIGALRNEELASTVLGNQAMAVRLKRGQFAQSSMPTC